MSYANRVRVNVDKISGNPQDMILVPDSVPAEYMKDPSQPSNYLACRLKQNTGSTAWDLSVYEGGALFMGSRDPSANNPVGDYLDGSDTAQVTEII